MTKAASYYICTNCGSESRVWSGKCYGCGEWNSLQARTISTPSMSRSAKLLPTQKITDVIGVDEKRLFVDLGETNRILGGGLVRGSVLLFAGEPGIGKSTLLLQLCGAVAKSNTKVLYVSGEESTRQVGLRARRLGITSLAIELVSTNNVDDITQLIIGGEYKLVVIDSIQTVQCGAVGSRPGSISQISSSTHLLMSAAKQSNTCVIIVGHVTKEGVIAGPKILEHIVDAVFQLEGDRNGGFKILRSVKNRFGSTNETALFEMIDNGLCPIENPSKALLSERQTIDGSIVFAAMEGSRALLVEVQALVTASSFGFPKRTASGIDLNRLNVLVAMLHKRTKIDLSNKDIFINIVGGIKVTEPAVDLAVCMAIASAAKGKLLNKNAVVCGEVGLAGEIRHIPFVEKRAQEAQALGFSGLIGPPGSSNKSTIFSVKDIRTALNTYLS